VVSDPAIPCVRWCFHPISFCLFAAPGVKIVDDPVAGRFPEPIGASGQDDVLVGRIREDISLPAGQGVNMFIAGDQLLKGAATNAVQIAELLL